MAGTYQESYLTSGEVALSWWKTLPSGYETHYVGENGKLLAPDDLGKYDSHHGLLWEVSAVNYPVSVVMVAASQPKNTLETEWRVDVIWHQDKYQGVESCETTATVVKQTLIVLGALPKKSEHRRMKVF